MFSMKTCRDCRVEKSVDEFLPNSKNKVGRTRYCRACLRVRHRSYRDARRGGAGRGEGKVEGADAVAPP